MLELCANDTNLRRAAELLRSGGIVAFPTETVYGLGAIATNANAVADVFAAKARPTFDPLIVHVGDHRMAEDVGDFSSPIVRKLADAFWPGPLTIVVPKHACIPGIVTSGLSTVGVRIPDHEVAQALLREVDAPLAAPSANPFGQLSPTRPEHVLRSFPSDGIVAAVIDGGPCEVGIESTIVQFSEEDNRLVILRIGGISQAELQACVGSLPIRLQTSLIDEQHQSKGLQAPGQLASHYAPRTPVMVIEHGNAFPDPPDGQRWGALCYARCTNNAAYVAEMVLSPTNRSTIAATNLFDYLHELDARALDCIVAELAPSEGLGDAINDRLRRGSTQNV